MNVVVNNVALALVVYNIGTCKRRKQIETTVHYPPLQLPWFERPHSLFFQNVFRSSSFPAIGVGETLVIAYSTVKHLVLVVVFSNVPAGGTFRIASWVGKESYLVCVR